jgi:hypothetical protein
MATSPGVAAGWIMIDRLPNSRLVPSRAVAAGPLLVCLVLASLGPYLVGGIRTEQVAVYGLAFATGMLAILRARQTAAVHLAPVAVPWLLYLTIALLASTGPTAQPAGSRLAGLDNLFSPVAIMLIVNVTVQQADAERHFRTVARLVALALGANGLLAVVMTQADLSPIFRSFWSGDAGVTTAENAAALGRISGVFNQPAEAGLAYGIAGLCAWYVWRHEQVRFLLGLAPIVVGGLLTVSKIFILGGLPILILLVLRSSRSRLGVFAAALLATLGALQAGLADSWTGAARLGRLLRPRTEGSLLEFFSGGRTEEAGSVQQAFDAVAGIDPVFGVGIQGLALPYDSGWTEAFVLAGAIGFGCYSLTLLGIGFMALRTEEQARRWFAYGLAGLAIGGSLGVPALTANRVGTLLWLLVALVALGQTSSDASKAKRGQPALSR